MRKGILLRSQRIVAQTWSMSTGLCDALIVLGNRVTAETYRLFDGLTIYPLDATAFIPSKPFQRSVSSSRKSFLWFGGCGLVHKGLDLCLEYFSQHPELTLHICGLREDDFFQAYQDELSQKNIIYHGCVDVLSDTFRDIAAQCLFTILPSCSEGQATALLTSMATGLIPVASRETGVDIQDRGFLIEFLTPEKVGEAVQRALNTAEPVLENMSETCRRSILASHEISVFRKNFRHIIEVVLNDGKIS
ncbi:MAG: glycosyltransferase [Candidatus Omnitrophica bacterium]|nr:glycosyltransferase [Candidatus Omnitrophota bacterium]